MVGTYYVYRNRAYTEAGAECHNRRIKAALAERYDAFGLPPKVIFSIDSPHLHRLVSDPVEVCRLVRAFPDCRVRVIPVVA